MSTGSASVAQRYAEGVAAYERRDFESASLIFNALVDAGEVQPTILMAMGNAAYRRERWVAAVYAFEWARMLAPMDQDVATNLELARARLVRDEFTDEGARGALRFREILRSVPTLWTGLAFALLWSFGWGLVALRQRGRAEGLGAVAIASLLLAVPLAAHLAFRVHDARGAEAALLQPTEVEVRSGPGDSYARIFTLHAGTLVATGEERAGWRRITLPQGAEGWAPASALAILGRPETLRER
jgi:hypothetical protein